MRSRRDGREEEPVVEGWPQGALPVMMLWMKSIARKEQPRSAAWGKLGPKEGTEGMLRELCVQFWTAVRLAGVGSSLQKRTQL